MNRLQSLWFCWYMIGLVAAVEASLWKSDGRCVN